MGTSTNEIYDSIRKELRALRLGRSLVSATDPGFLSWPGVVGEGGDKLKPTLPLSGELFAALEPGF